MSKILVSGLINIETNVAVAGFPMEYYPINYNFGGVSTAVSGVGYNVAKALKTLGSSPIVYSIGGQDFLAKIIAAELAEQKLDVKLCPNAAGTPQSVILFDKDGKRRIELDLKDVQEASFSDEQIENAFCDVSVAVLCNINFSRKLIPYAKQSGVTIATDVHVLSDIYDDYNKEFLATADILFLSNEHIMGREEAFVRSIADAYSNSIIVVGMGAKGALMYVRKDDKFTMQPAMQLRPIVNTVGAGDALFSGFVHFYNYTKDPYFSLQRATAFASYKIGESGGAKGFATEQELEKYF